MAPQYNIARRGIVTKFGAPWIVKTISSMVARHAKGERSFISVWFKDAWSKIYLRPIRNYGARFFQLELPMEDSTLEDGILIILEEKNGDGWREFAKALINFMEAGSGKGKWRNVITGQLGKVKRSKQTAAMVAVVEKGAQPFWYKKANGESVC